VGRGLLWVEEWVGLPDLVEVLDAESRVLEQMRNLVVDLERVLVALRQSMSTRGNIDWLNGGAEMASPKVLSV
jgi:hypothetical protein